MLFEIFLLSSTECSLMLTLKQTQLQSYINADDQNTLATSVSRHQTATEESAPRGGQTGSIVSSWSLIFTLFGFSCFTILFFADHKSEPATTRTCQNTHKLIIKWNSSQLNSFLCLCCWRAHMSNLTQLIKVCVHEVSEREESGALLCDFLLFSQLLILRSPQMHTDTRSAENKLVLCHQSNTYSRTEM